MRAVTNKTNKPIAVPLPRGKILRLGRATRRWAAAVAASGRRAGRDTGRRPGAIVAAIDSSSRRAASPIAS
jgi:hypothetical protein